MVKLSITNTFTDILTECRDLILRIIINRPQKKNALTRAMYAAMADAISRAQKRIVAAVGGGWPWVWARPSGFTVTWFMQANAMKR